MSQTAAAPMMKGYHYQSAFARNAGFWSTATPLSKKINNLLFPGITLINLN